MDVANALKAKGAKRIFCGLSHIMLLKRKGSERSRTAPSSSSSRQTPSLPFEGKTDKIRIVSVAPLFAETVRRTHDREGIGELLANIPKECLIRALPSRLSFSDTAPSDEPFKNSCHNANPAVLQGVNRAEKNGDRVSRIFYAAAVRGLPHRAGSGYPRSSGKPQDFWDNIPYIARQKARRGIGLHTIWKSGDTVFSKLVYCFLYRS